jgi:hypothetical protein
MHIKVSYWILGIFLLSVIACKKDSATEPSSGFRIDGNYYCSCNDTLYSIPYGGPLKTYRNIYTQYITVVKDSLSGSAYTLYMKPGLYDSASKVLSLGNWKLYPTHPSPTYTWSSMSAGVFGGEDFTFKKDSLLYLYQFYHPFTGSGGVLYDNKKWYCVRLPR